MRRLPWLAPISTVTLHIPLTALWAWLTGKPDPLAVIAWPQLAGRSLADRCDAVAR